VQFVAFNQAGAVAVDLLEAVVFDQAVAVSGDVLAAVVANGGVAVVEDYLLKVTLGPQVDFFLACTVFDQQFVIATGVWRALAAQHGFGFVRR